MSHVSPPLLVQRDATPAAAVAPVVTNCGTVDHDASFSRKNTHCVVGPVPLPLVPPPPDTVPTSVHPLGVATVAVSGLHAIVTSTPSPLAREAGVPGVGDAAA